MSIASKITAIIAKAEGSTHPEEAQAFMAKAQQLMQSHGLDLLDLGKLSDDPIGVDINAVKNFQSDNWQTGLAAAAAHYYGCRTVVSHRGCTYFHSVGGRESARITFTLMFGYFTRSVSKLATEAVKAGEYKTPSIARTAIGKALTVRITQALRSARAVEGTGINALVPVDLVDLALQEAFPRMREGKARKISYSSAAMSHASKIGLNLQTAGGKAALQIGK
jgi:hypothetical protein